MWKSIETAPKDRSVLLWFPDVPLVCIGTFACLEDGNEDGSGAVWAWVIPEGLGERKDGIVWEWDRIQPTMWMYIPGTRGRNRCQIDHRY